MMVRPKVAIHRPSEVEISGISPIVQQCGTYGQLVCFRVYEII